MSRLFGDTPDWVVKAEEAERDRITSHAVDCYGKYGSCQSCGCRKREDKACSSHAGNPEHMATLQERQIAVLDRIANALEARS